MTRHDDIERAARLARRAGRANLFVANMQLLPYILGGLLLLATCGVCGWALVTS